MNSQVELKIQQGIREAEDDLVRLIENALDTATYKSLEESQFRNLVRVADTTSSAEVIKNFLRYQTGREEKWGRGEDSLAERIIKDIGNIDRGGTLIDRAKQIADSAKTEDFKRIWIELIRRYLGYGSRYLKYLNVSKTTSKQQSNQTSPKKS